MRIKTPANTLKNTIIRITGFGASFQMGAKSTPELHTPAPYLPPEAFFKNPISLAADIWTFGVSLLGERYLFETLA